MIETARLIIKPLTHSQLIKYLQNDQSLEAELNVQQSSRTISPELREALEQTILPNVADENKNYLFSTLWTAISKAENKMIGDLCIIGEPNNSGEIEIGYGTYEDSRKKGFMTEAIGGIIQWAREEPAVQSIIASTEKINAASCAVLQKNNFEKRGETGTLIQWRLQLKK